MTPDFKLIKKTTVLPLFSGLETFLDLVCYCLKHYVLKRQFTLYFAVWTEEPRQSQARDLYPARNHCTAWHTVGPCLLLLRLPDHCGPLSLLHPELTARSAQPPSTFFSSILHVVILFPA